MPTRNQYLPSRHHHRHHHQQRRKNQNKSSSYRQTQSDLRSFDVRSTAGRHTRVPPRGSRPDGDDADGGRRRRPAAEPSGPNPTSRHKTRRKDRAAAAAAAAAHLHGVHHFNCPARVGRPVTCSACSCPGSGWPTPTSECWCCCCCWCYFRWHYSESTRSAGAAAEPSTPSTAGSDDYVNVFHLQLDDWTSSTRSDSRSYWPRPTPTTPSDCFAFDSL